MKKEAFRHFAKNSLEDKLLKLCPGEGQVRVMFSVIPVPLNLAASLASLWTPCLFSVSPSLIWVLSPSLTCTGNTGELSSWPAPSLFALKWDCALGLYTQIIANRDIALSRKQETQQCEFSLCGLSIPLKYHTIWCIYFKAHLLLSDWAGRKVGSSAAAE